MEAAERKSRAPFTAAWSSDAEAVQFAEADQYLSIAEPSLPITVPVSLAAGEATISGDLTIYYCEAVRESLCFIDRVRVEIPVRVEAAGSGSVIRAERVIVPPEVPTGSITG